MVIGSHFHKTHLAFGLRADHLIMDSCILAHATEPTDGTINLPCDTRRAGVFVNEVAGLIEVAHGPLSIRGVPAATCRVVALVVASEE